MKKILLILSVTLTSLSCWSQNAVLKPGQTYLNQSQDTLFLLKSQTVRSLMADAESNKISLEKVKLYQKQIQLKDQRIALADSAFTIKRLEADYWRQQLLQSDAQLETQRLENVKLMDDRSRIRQSRIYYLIAGFIGGAVLISR